MSLFKTIAFFKVLDEGLESLMEQQSIFVGTSARGAWFLEMGSGPHESSRMADQFKQRMLEWGSARGFSEPEIYAIMENIRQEGVQSTPTPFWRNAVLAVSRQFEFLEANEVEAGNWEIIVVDPIQYILSDEDLHSIAQKIKNRAQQNLRSDASSPSGDRVATGRTLDSFVITEDESQI